MHSLCKKVSMYLQKQNGEIERRKKEKKSEESDKARKNTQKKKKTHGRFQNGTNLSLGHFEIYLMKQSIKGKAPQCQR